MVYLPVIIWIISGVLFFIFVVFSDWYDGKNITMAYFLIFLPICVIFGGLVLLITALLALPCMVNSITIIKGRNSK